MTTTVLAWLAHPADFAAGVALYAALGGSPVYRQLFALGATSYSRQVLVRELTALASRPPEVVPAPPAAKPALRHENGAKPAETTQPAPATVPTEQHRQLKALRDERSQLHAQLTAPRLRQSDRLKHALRILALGDEVLGAEQRLAYVAQHGQLPPGPVATAELTDAGELRRRLDNLISLRAKVRKRPDRAGELPGLEADIQLIREKLTPTTSCLH